LQERRRGKIQAKKNIEKDDNVTSSGEKVCGYERKTKLVGENGENNPRRPHAIVVRGGRRS